MAWGEPAVKARVTTPQDVRTPRLDDSTMMFRTQRRDRTTLHSTPCPRRRLAPLGLIDNPNRGLNVACGHVVD